MAMYRPGTSGAPTVAIDAGMPPGALPVAMAGLQHYPHHLVAMIQLPDGTPVLTRPIAPQDRRRHWRFLCSLSLQSRYQRLMSPRCLLPGELRRMVEIDYRREMALVALVQEPGGGELVEIGVARYVRGEASDTAEFALVVTDAWQRRGLGRRLLERLIATATATGIRHLGGITLATNTPMIRLARRLGFALSAEPGDWTVKRLQLVQAGVAMPAAGAPGPSTDDTVPSAGDARPPASTAGATTQ